MVSECIYYYADTIKLHDLNPEAVVSTMAMSTKDEVTLIMELRDLAEGIVKVKSLTDQVGDLQRIATSAESMHPRMAGSQCSFGPTLPAFMFL